MPLPRRQLLATALTALASATALTASAGAAQVRFLTPDGRQLAAVEAQTVGQARSTLNRVERAVVGAAPGADGTCAAEPTTKAFAALGDDADYALAPAGDFESRTSDWQLTDATVVPGNERLGILDGWRSLLIGVFGRPDASAYTPPICVDPSRPTFRFVYRAWRPGTAVITTLRFHPKDDPRVTVEIDSTTNASDDADWTAAAPNALATKIAQELMNDSGAVEIGFRAVEPDGDAGRVQIDDVLVDPYRRG